MSARVEPTAIEMSVGEIPPAAPLSTASAPTSASRDPQVILEVRDLRTYFFTYDGIVRALDGVNLKVRRGETTGLVGETGCGKSVTAFSITRLIADPPGRIVSGSVRLGSANLLWGLEEEAKFRRDPKTDRVRIRRSFRRIKQANDRMGAVRGRRIAMIFQEPSQAMNPIFSISNQISESLLLHRGIEVVDGMLGATLDEPAVEAACEALAQVVANDEPSRLRAACTAVGDAAHLPTLGYELYHELRPMNLAPEQAAKEIHAIVARRRLSPGQRRYLLHRRRLMETEERQRAISMHEMEVGQRETMARIAVNNSRRRERLSHFYYRIWGIRSRVRHPLDRETFWRTVSLLEGVSIASPAQIARGYPHELSGGMLQRVMIAMALSTDPDVLIADEPTTALDVTIQAQILALMRNLKERVGTAIVLITHDLAVIAEVADRVNVMYAGRIVESAPVRELFRRPLHPYSQGLLASIPHLERPEKELASIPGSVPNLLRPPSGCRFHPRCAYAMPICSQQEPPITNEGPGHTVACYLYKGPVATE